MKSHFWLPCSGQWLLPAYTQHTCIGAASVFAEIRPEILRSAHSVQKQEQCAVDTRPHLDRREMVIASGTSLFATYTYEIAGRLVSQITNCDANVIVRVQPSFASLPTHPPTQTTMRGTMFVHHYLAFTGVILWIQSEYSDCVAKLCLAIACFALLEFPLFAGLLAYRMFKDNHWTKIMLKFAIGFDAETKAVMDKHQPFHVRVSHGY